MSMFGVISFTAPYLPWVMLGFGFFVGNPVDMSIVGIFVGHSYYFLEYVYPVVAEIRGWKRKRLLVPPRVFRYLCGEELEDLRMADGVMMRADVGGGEFHEHQD